MKNPTLSQISADIRSIKDQLKNTSSKDDLKNLATKDDLKNYATKNDFKILRNEMKQGFRSVIEYMDSFFVRENRIKNIETTVANHEVRLLTLEQK